MENLGLWDMIQSHALLMHSSDNFIDVWLRYKLLDGQTAPAKRMFHEVIETGLEYVFRTLIISIAQDGAGERLVTVMEVGGKNFRAESRLCQEAIDIGHVNQMTKIHADVSNRGLLHV
ncbi:hypothetical protein F4805DRAFT_448870 [Annulohypoxylon moriforme]|nr:hypothetical protein F4805DRAFT_448870 [Annulohypoxylon moriforme]